MCITKIVDISLSLNLGLAGFQVQIKDILKERIFSLKKLGKPIPIWHILLQNNKLTDQR